MRSRSLTAEFMRESGAFAVNVLPEGQELLGGHFGLRSGGNVHKFEELPPATGVTGAPLLRDGAAVLECGVVGRHEVGQSVLVIGEIVHAERLGGWRRGIGRGITIEKSRLNVGF